MYIHIYIKWIYGRTHLYVPLPRYTHEAPKATLGLVPCACVLVPLCI